MELISMEELLALLREICGEESIAPNTELMESGLLDSYAFINLLSELDMRGSPHVWDRRISPRRRGYIRSAGNKLK